MTLLLVSCGPHLTHEKNEPYNKIIIVDKIPDWNIFQRLNKRIYPSDEQIGGLVEESLNKVIYYKDNNVEYILKNGEIENKEYIKTKLPEISWKQNVCEDGYGEVQGWEIFDTDEEVSGRMLLYVAKGLCGDKEVSCSLLNFQFQGDSVFEINPKGCENFSFGYENYID